MNMTPGEKQAQVTVDTAVPGLTIRESDYTVRYEQGGTPATPVNTGSYDIILTLENDNLRFDGMDDSLREQKAGTTGDHRHGPIPRPTP